ncbi:hypothetical protein MG290_01685 [Flavobacterium sp. CBA20B-1]|uniref:hypothetical protein n=1 Tax=unclassified Flavobacterium TaxID=196869 RepID=UPI002224CB28|nr:MULTISPECIES: hypothetical protein [unclassified Flavobacterium]WCM42407.1 hypothetical protein MG290_01685 [Flavobacterium sp. CBA20B-1]
MEDLKLATSAIALILFLVIPGISFKGGYYTQRFESLLNRGSFQDRLVSTIFISILFQICIILLNNYFFDSKISFKTYTTPLQEDFLSNYNNIDFDRKTLVFVLKYLLFSSVFPFFIGLLFNKLICFFNLDLYISYFRSNDYWYYYFRGNIPNNDRFRKKIKNVKINSTIIDALIETPNDSRLYSGYYVNHTLKKDSNDIDTLILTDVNRFSNNQKKFVTVPGHYFKINGNKIINLNTRYIEEKVVKRRRSFDINSFLAILLLTEIIISFIIPFYLEGGFFKLILNIIILLLISLFSTTLFHSVFSKEYKPDRLKTVFGFIISVIIFGLVFYFINKGSF